MQTVTFITLGCKLNQAETAMLTKDFEGRGYQVVSQDESADVGIINTCTVTGRSASKCRQAIRKLLKNNSEMTLIVTGCYSQVEPEEVSALQGVDYILGVQEKLNIFDFFPGPGKLSNPKVFVESVEETKIANLHDVGNYKNQTRAFLKIQNGCDRHCAYCIVPIARGPSRSVPVQSVIEQANTLLSDGYKEIVLTGVHVGDYGKDFHYGNGSLLPQLLEKINEIEGQYRVRISSTDPIDMTDELIDVMVKNTSICRHFHVPIQSGCNKTLNAMNRKYSAEFVSESIQKIKSKLGNAGIGADVIVGFPGETDDDFELTYKFVQNQPFSYLHVFPFSARKGTKAADMVDVIDSKTITQRAKRLRHLGNEKKTQWLSKWIDQTVEVLLENTNINGKMAGYTSEYARIEVPYNESLCNQLVQIYIKELNGSTLIGKVVD